MIASWPARPSSTWRSTNHWAAFNSRGITAPTLPRRSTASSARGGRDRGTLRTERPRESGATPLHDRGLAVRRARLARHARVGAPRAGFVRGHAADQPPRAPFRLERRALRSDRSDPLLV